MDERDVRIAQKVAFAIVNSIQGESVTLGPELFKVMYTQTKLITSEIEKYGFKKFENWGLRLGMTPKAIASQDQNWRWRSMCDAEKIRLMDRYHAIDKDPLLGAVESFCEQRYDAGVRSAYVLGGYLYGQTDNPEDLDIIIILEKDGVLETGITLRPKELSSWLPRDRSVTSGIDLSVVSETNANESIASATALRLAIIAMTTSFPLKGPAFLDRPVPVAQLIFLAKELASTACKSLLDTDSAGLDKAIGRLSEAGQVLEYLYGTLRGEELRRDLWHNSLWNEWTISSRDSHQALRLFTSNIARLKDDIESIELMIRQEALNMLDAQLNI